MKVSIVIPTYNQADYIRDCLQSIQSQTYKDLEIIIQDSYSPDQTESICNEFVSTDSRFKYFKEKDSGQSDGINKGLARCTGELFTWICSDDFYTDPLAIQHAVEALRTARKQSEKFIGCFGLAKFVSDAGVYEGPYTTFKRDVVLEDFKHNWPFSQPASFVLREEMVRVGGVDPSLHLGMDLDLFIKLLQGDRKLSFFPHYVANVRLQPNSKSVKFRSMTAENALEIIKKHYGDMGSTKHSAYLQELKLSVSDELWSKWYPRASWLHEIPVIGKQFKSLSEFAHEVMNPKSKHTGIGYSLFRGVWTVYRWIKTPPLLLFRKVNDYFAELLIHFKKKSQNRAT